MALLACLIPLPHQRRMVACAIGASGIAVCTFMIYSSALLSEHASLNLRDWLPVILILAAYHQSGQFFVKPWLRFQNFLLKLDRRLLGRFGGAPEGANINSVLSVFLEISYLSCYPLIPAALGTLILLNLEDRVEEFWMVVLPPTYLCYALVPILSALPPRLIKGDSQVAIQPGKARSLNIWILRHGSIRANTFPSAHVAACTAASLVLLRYDVLAGSIFSIISLSIAAAVVIRRYHYLADSVLGVTLPIVPFLITG